MKLGLVRHFKVITDENKFLSSAEFSAAMQRYDEAPVSRNGLLINSSDWDICYCSDLPRAVTTAKEIYENEIIETKLIREVPISPVFSTRFKLPITLWHIMARFAWYKNHESQSEGIDGTKERIRKFYEVLSKSGYDKILIVSHGYFLHMFYEEMKKKGFHGDIEINIKNAKLYTIERN